MSSNDNEEVSTDLIESEQILDVVNADSAAASTPSSSSEQLQQQQQEQQPPKKRKVEAIEDEDSGREEKKGSFDFSSSQTDEDSTKCTICFEQWTNSGEHRISSLRCGHFFGLSCIERWLKMGKDFCPTCHDKAAKKDIRPHYVRNLIAIDTAERDRALKDLEESRKAMRALELDHAALKVTSQTRKEEIEKLQEQIRHLRSGLLGPIPTVNNVEGSSLPGTSGASPSMSYSRLLYLKRSELIRREALQEGQPNKYCRVMAYNETHGMLVVSQPSFTALAPGYGVRRVNMLDRRLESFVSLHKEPIRDLAFNPVFQDQLLSVAQDKTVRLTNISTCAEIQRYHCESEIWSCAWNSDDPNVFFVGTKRCELFVYDTRVTGGEPKFQLQFPLTERRPIIALCYVPRQADHRSFPSAGLLVQTLGSLWFFELTSSGEVEAATEVSYKVHKLAITGLFWSLKFDLTTRMFLASTKPTPHARHMVCELTRINVSEDPDKPDFQISTNVIMDQTRGGSYSEKSFLRSALCPRPGSDNLLVLYGRGSAHSDHKLIVQEVGNDRIVQEIPVDRPIVDVCAFSLNAEHYVAVLCEAELIMYKWS